MHAWRSCNHFFRFDYFPAVYQLRYDRVRIVSLGASRYFKVVLCYTNRRGQEQVGAPTAKHDRLLARTRTRSTSKVAFKVNNQQRGGEHSLTMSSGPVLSSHAWRAAFAHSIKAVSGTSIPRVAAANADEAHRTFMQTNSCLQLQAARARQQSEQSGASFAPCDTPHPFMRKYAQAGFEALARRGHQQ